MKLVFKVVLILVVGAVMMVSCPDERAHRAAIDGRIASDSWWINSVCP